MRLSIKKIVSGILVLSVVFTLAACGGKKEETGSVDVKALFDQVVAADTQLPEMKTITSSDADADINFTVLCDIEYDRIAEYYYTYAADGSAPEIAVIRVKDKSDVATLMSKLKEHVQDRQGAMAEYSPEQVDMVSAFVLTRKDDMVLLAIGPQNGLVQKAFEGDK